MKSNLDAVNEVEKACREAKIDEIDLGASSVKDFQFELDLLDDTIRQKESFVENRMCRPRESLRPPRLLSVIRPLHRDSRCEHDERDP